MALPPNFSFILSHRLAGSGHPGSGATLLSTLASLREVGIGAILSLTEEPLEFAPIREFSFEYLHLPVDDFTAPTHRQIEQAVKFLNDQAEHGHGTLVHCRAGIGRTGTILACYLVSQGQECSEAIQELRRLRPGSIEVYTQEYCVYQFAKRLQQPPDVS